MALHVIRHRWTRKELAAIEAPTYARALEWAGRRGMSLSDADLAGAILRGAFLAGSDLRGADMSGAHLAGAYLRRADLRGVDARDSRLSHSFLCDTDLRRANLEDADLTRADLRGANLVGAHLRGSIFTGAQLDGAILDWRWAAIPAEILRTGKGEAIQRLAVALAFWEDLAPWSWLKVIFEGSRAAENAALARLAGFVRDGDNAPSTLRAACAPF